MKVCIIGYGYIGKNIASALSGKHVVSVVSRNTLVPAPECHSFERIVNMSFGDIHTEWYSQFDCIVYTVKPTDVFAAQTNVRYLVDVLNENQSLVLLNSAAAKINNHSESDTYIQSKRVEYATSVWSGKKVYTLVLGSVNGGMVPVGNTNVINSMASTSNKNDGIDIFSPSHLKTVLGIRDLENAVEKCVSGTVDPGVYSLYSLGPLTVLEIGIAVADHTGKFTRLRGNESGSPRGYSFTSTSRPPLEFEFHESVQSIVQSIVEYTPKKLWTVLRDCLCCGNNNLHSLLSLGANPLANGYTRTILDSVLVPRAPNALKYCNMCFHVQQSVSVDPSVLFRDYKYVSGTSSTGRRHFRSFAKNVVDKFRPSTVLDIACNDGSQLDAFLGFGVKTTGIDPAISLCEVARAKGHTVYTGFFEDVEIDGTFDVIIAQNVFAHVPDPFAFLKRCISLCHKESVILVQTSQSNMILNGEYDTAYHEHLSFFNTGSMKILCERAGLFLNRVDILDIHGTSYLFTITKSPQPESNVADRLLIEMDTGIYSTDTYDTVYPLKVRAGIHTILAQMCTLLAKGHTIVCYGSTAKFTTVINTLRLSSDTIDYIVDENPLKMNTFVPGTCIPVKSPDELYADLGRNVSIAIVVSAWNFHTEIEAKIKSAGFSNAYVVALARV